MEYFRNIYFDIRWFCEEISILIKYPTRKASWQELNYHIWKLWNHAVGHPWYALKRGIRNLWVWFPIIFKNDVFDHFYLEDLIDKQLSEMETFWYSDYPHVTKQKHIAKRITWIRKLLKMYREDHYTMIDYYEREAKFPKSKEHGLFGKSVPATTDEFGVVTSYLCVDERTDEEKEDYRTKAKIAREKDEKVFKLFIKNLSRYREFWD